MNGRRGRWNGHDRSRIPQGADPEVATQALNAELQDKGFLLTTTEDLINWGRTGSRCTG